MFSIPCDSVLSSLPFIMALFWPFVGTFYGLDTVMRQSLVFCIYFIICDMIQRALNSLLKSESYLLPQFLNTVIFALLLCQSYVIIPTFLVRIYTILIKFSEPLMIVIETIQCVRIIAKCGQLLSDNIYSASDESKSFMWKAVVLAIAGVSLVFAFLVMRRALINAQSVVFTYISVLLVLFQVILIISTIYVEEGVISDTSLVFLLSSLALYMSIFEYNDNTNKSYQMQWSEETRNLSDGKSLLNQLLSLPDVSTAFTSEGLRWAKQHYGIAFWSALIIRIACILTCAIDHHFVHRSQLYDYNNDDEQSLWSSRVSANTLIKVIATLIYSGMLAQQLPDSWPSLDTQWMQSFLRIAQSFSLGIYYFYTLFASVTSD